MRNNAEDPNLPGRNSGRDGRAMSAAPAAAAATAATDGELSGRVDGPGWCHLPGPTAAAAAAAGASFGRTRLVFRGPAHQHRPPPA
jgi:hypothetical protein